MTAERVGLRAQVITGLEPQPEGVIAPLDAAAWRARRQRLRELGGLPAP